MSASPPSATPPAQPWKSVIIHSDGACERNPGPGGWAAILRYGPQTKRIRGGELATTNNRMELRAALEALACLREPCAVEFHTDSEYLRLGISRWLRGWKRRGWITQEGDPVKNVDLWQRLDELNSRHRVTWHWVRGHNGDPFNEQCDQLARDAIAHLHASHSRAEFATALSLLRRRNQPQASQPPEE